MATMVNILGKHHNCADVLCGHTPLFGKKLL